jgi:hypothetical protein
VGAGGAGAGRVRGTPPPDPTSARVVGQATANSNSIRNGGTRLARRPTMTTTARTVAAVSTVLLVACDGAAGTSTAHMPSPVARSPVSDLIPWTPDVAAPEPTPTPTPNPTSLPLPACRAGQLMLREGASSAGLGHGVSRLVFTNRSAQRCKLAGLPKVILHDRFGRILPRPSVGYGDDGFFPTSPNGGVALEPGVPIGPANSPAVDGQALLDIQFLSMGSFPTPIATIEVRLPEGGGGLLTSYSLPWRGCMGEGCLDVGIGISSFQWPEPPSSPPAPPVQFARTYRVPPQARLGRDLVYSVTLTNVSGHAITMDTCPGYSESLTRIASLERHRLNCGPARTFGVGQSRSFAMRLLLPATAASDVTTALLSWVIDLPFTSGDEAGPASIRIVDS